MTECFSHTSTPLYHTHGAGNRTPTGTRRRSPSPSSPTSPRGGGSKVGRAVVHGAKRANSTLHHTKSSYAIPASPPSSPKNDANRRRNWKSMSTGNTPTKRRTRTATTTSGGSSIGYTSTATTGRSMRKNHKANNTRGMDLLSLMDQTSTNSQYHHRLDTTTSSSIVGGSSNSPSSALVVEVQQFLASIKADKEKQQQQKRDLYNMKQHSPTTTGLDTTINSQTGTTGRDTPTQGGVVTNMLSISLSPGGGTGSSGPSSPLVGRGSGSTTASPLMSPTMALQRERSFTRDDNTGTGPPTPAAGVTNTSFGSGMVSPLLRGAQQAALMQQQALLRSNCSTPTAAHQQQQRANTPQQSPQLAGNDTVDDNNLQQPINQSGYSLLLDGEDTVFGQSPHPPQKAKSYPKPWRTRKQKTTTEEEYHYTPPAKPRLHNPDEDKEPPKTISCHDFVSKRKVYAEEVASHALSTVELFAGTYT
eukprot:TRINITY_DN48975_c0_g1_i1.p1 TRINITY_DN48975_c0_g1~~TRINITY_DN48975_c0_g1_i1.p1  ORF type:complete len:505 (-),score=78.14 TRINITY_DN48975_c0_g1_i1:295-1719(-)